ncbi:nucleolar protein dao-5-like [Dermacentor silvarum]|uniref:nucleolar protein dao-5-like n=1 Tax=Dermacentor silvarum TaxID=543639 RepID=UPI00210196DF|nr:nucleolar protein dao-5-like [Dermacentor silvarum]
MALEEDPSKRQAVPPKRTRAKQKPDAAEDGGIPSLEATSVKRLHARPANKDPFPPTTRSRSEKPAAPKAIATTASAKVRKASDEPAPAADVNVPPTSKGLSGKAQRLSRKTRSWSSSRRWRQSISRGHHLQAAACKRTADKDPSPPTTRSRSEKPAAPKAIATTASAKMRKASDEPAPDADVNVPSTSKELSRKAQSASRKTRSRSFSRRWRQSISRGHHLHAAACKRPANKDPSPPTTRSRSEKSAAPKAIATTASAKVREASDQPASDADVNVPSTSEGLSRKAQRVIRKTRSRSSSPSKATSATAKATTRRHCS